MFLWWLLLACLLVLPVLLRFAAEEPDNAIRHEQQDAKPKDPDAEFAPAA